MRNFDQVNRIINNIRTGFQENLLVRYETKEAHNQAVPIIPDNVIARLIDLSQKIFIIKQQSTDAFLGSFVEVFHNYLETIIKLTKTDLNFQSYNYIYEAINLIVDMQNYIIDDSPYLLTKFAFEMQQLIEKINQNNSNNTKKRKAETVASNNKEKRIKPQSSSTYFTPRQETIDYIKSKTPFKDADILFKIISPNLDITAAFSLMQMLRLTQDEKNSLVKSLIERDFPDRIVDFFDENGNCLFPSITDYRAIYNNLQRIVFGDSELAKQLAHLFTLIRCNDKHHCFDVLKENILLLHTCNHEKISPIALANKLGNQELLELFYKLIKQFYPSSSHQLMYAIECNQKIEIELGINNIRWNEISINYCLDLMCACIEANNLPLLQEILSRIQISNPELYDFFQQTNEEPHYIQNHPSYDGYTLMEVALMLGHIEIFEYLHANHLHEFGKSKILSAAALSGHVDVFMKLFGDIETQEGLRSKRISKQIGNGFFRGSYIEGYSEGQFDNENAPDIAPLNLDETCFPLALKYARFDIVRRILKSIEKYTENLATIVSEESSYVPAVLASRVVALDSMSVSSHLAVLLSGFREITDEVKATFNKLIAKIKELQVEEDSEEDSSENENENLNEDTLVYEFNWKFILDSSVFDTSSTLNSEEPNFDSLGFDLKPHLAFLGSITFIKSNYFVAQIYKIQEGIDFLTHSQNHFIEYMPAVMQMFHAVLQAMQLYPAQTQENLLRNFLNDLVPYLDFYPYLAINFFEIIKNIAENPRANSKQKAFLQNCEKLLKLEENQALANLITQVQSFVEYKSPLLAALKSIGTKMCNSFPKDLLKPAEHGARYNAAPFFEKKDFINLSQLLYNAQCLAATDKKSCIFSTLYEFLTEFSTLFNDYESAYKHENRAEIYELIRNTLNVIHHVGLWFTSNNIDTSKLLTYIESELENLKEKSNQIKQNANDDKQAFIGKLPAWLQPVWANEFNQTLNNNNTNNQNQNEDKEVAPKSPTYSRSNSDEE